ncbi:MAG: FliH/SctL family protein [Candidatus Margulisiibacteriota bacterium]|nr:FliH/SctL family protein [Candidatus Margulisiibacteriota bacterium]
MGLIKRDLIEEKGTLLIEKKAPVLPPRPKVEMAPQRPASETEIKKSKNEAQEIIEAARQEAADIKEEAKEAGRQEGRQEASSRIEEAMETLNAAVKERKKIISDSENEILRLSLKVAEQIIRSEVSLHRDVCLNIVSEAISRVSDREQIIVKVNREDAEYLKRYKDRLAGMLDGVKSFSIIEDANIEPGGCVIETNLGFIDARIATKIKSIEEALNKVSSSKEEKNPAQ